jgi:hypothetical protein
MKVKTNLKAGNVLNDAVDYAKQTVDTATGFVASASQQANALVDTVGTTVTSPFIRRR